MENVMTTTAPARTHTATVVVVGPSARLTDAIEALGSVDLAGAVRSVLIPTDSSSAPSVPDKASVIAIAGLKADYLDNAIAALRLSSLPTIVWWRGGNPARLDGVASLADRVVLDAEDAAPLWRRAATLFERAAITDLRWARLTRWRAVLAHFFDLQQIRDAAPTFTRVAISGSDRALCTLFAGWLDASLGWQGRVSIELVGAAADPPIGAVVLDGGAADITLRLLPNGTCLDTAARTSERTIASRVASLGDQRLPALLAQELRVRSRDPAFERAIAAAEFLGM
jgi:glucose-6-phosphate dehydrogenase assembly protein OpcA